MGRSSAPPRDLAGLLLRKAAQDEFAVGKLVPDPATPDEVIGFHAQQAVEKWLKAVLTARGLPYRRTHDLVELIDLLYDAGVPVPGELEEVRCLTPYAVEYRYDASPEGPDDPLDRPWLAETLRRVRAWAEGEVQAASPPEPTAEP